MALTIKDIIELRSPEFFLNPNLDKYIELAQQRVNQYTFDKHYENAVALTVLHMMALTERSDGNAGASGSIKSQKEGQLSQSFSNIGGNSTFGSHDLSQTSWGMEFQDLIRDLGYVFTNRMM